MLGARLRIGKIINKIKMKNNPLLQYRYIRVCILAINVCSPIRLGFDKFCFVKHGELLATPTC
jgi:hypothetical protein